MIPKGKKRREPGLFQQPARAITARWADVAQRGFLAADANARAVGLGLAGAFVRLIFWRARIGCAFLGCQGKKAVDELSLSKKIISCHPSNLPLPDHLDRFVALNR